MARCSLLFSRHLKDSEFDISCFVCTIVSNFLSVISLMFDSDDFFFFFSTRYFSRSRLITPRQGRVTGSTYLFYDIKKKRKKKREQRKTQERGQKLGNIYL